MTQVTLLLRLGGAVVHFRIANPTDIAGLREIPG